MSVYYIAEHIITDPVKFEEYRVKVAPMIASYGGRYITKAGSHKFPESPHWKPERVVTILLCELLRVGEVRGSHSSVAEVRWPGIYKLRENHAATTLMPP